MDTLTYLHILTWLHASSREVTIPDTAETLKYFTCNCLQNLNRNNCLVSLYICGTTIILLPIYPILGTAYLAISYKTKNYDFNCVNVHALTLACFKKVSMARKLHKKKIHSIQFLVRKICLEAETEKSAALSRSLLHIDFEIVWWKRLTVLCSDVNVGTKSKSQCYTCPCPWHFHKKLLKSS